MSAPQDIAQQLRRRRAASYRLPPLDCGRRDPLDPYDDGAVQLLTDHALDAWIDAAQLTNTWWAIPVDIRPQVRRRLVQRRAAA